MGFFGAFGKVLAGKPIYTPEDVAANQQGAASNQQTDSGPKQIPELFLGRVECLPKGENVEVYADVVNHSSEPVFVDDITVLGQRRELQRQLRPGEVHQVLVYTGPALSGQPQGYAELRFRQQSDGDYFKNLYQYYCVRQDNGSYYIGEFRQAGQTKDI